MDGTMKAVVKRRPGPGAALEVMRIPVPGPREVLVKVHVASICGTDLHIYNWDPWAASRIKPPLVFGHELAGEVVKVGPQVTRDIKVGDYVSAESHLTCGICYQCQTGHSHICQDYRILGVDFDGAFAEFVRLPEQSVWKNRPSIPPEVASIQDPFGNALLTASSVDVTAKTVVVSGCGSIGLFAVAIARASGARRVIAVDPNEYRLEIAGSLGANPCLNPSKDDVIASIRQLTDGSGADFVMEMSGNPEALISGLKVLKNGGHLALLGIPTTPVSLNLADDVVFKGITIHGVTGREIFGTWHKVSALLDGVVDITKVLTHTYKLEEFEEAFALMNEGRCGKVLLYP